MANNIDLAEIIPLIPNLPPVPGRLELVYSKNGKRAVIDYAHTPDALEKALHILRPYTTGKLLLVMGCGGDRDQGKRSLMGEIAARYADIIFITDDNPRNEDPNAIRAEIAASCPQGLNIAGRKQAIHLALSQIGQEDLVLIAGKGHEKYQIIGQERIPFDDCAIVMNYNQ